MKKVLIFTSIIVVLLFVGNFCSGEEPANKEQKYVGEFFDIRVPLENYLFVKSVIAVFGNRWGPPPKTPEQEEGYIWEQLLFSYEAFRRGVSASQEEISQEITKILQSENAGFDWKSDKQVFEKWVKEKTNEPAELFQNQVRHLLEIDKLRQQIIDGATPQVKEKEAYQEFLNENNNLGLEIVQFDKEKDAYAFYGKASSSRKFWEEEKNKNPQRFKRIGTVTIAFLIDLWRFPKDPLYKMLRMKNGEICEPIPIYKGLAVLRVLDKRPADLSQYKKSKDHYYEKVRRRKKYDALNEWMKDLKKQANIKIYNNALIEGVKKGG